MTTLFSVRYTQREARSLQSAFVRCQSTDIDAPAIIGIIGALCKKTGLLPAEIHVCGVDRMDEVLEAATSDGIDHTDGQATAGDAAAGTAGGESAGGKPATDTRPRSSASTQVAARNPSRR